MYGLYNIQGTVHHLEWKRIMILRITYHSNKYVRAELGEYLDSNPNDAPSTKLVLCYL